MKLSWMFGSSMAQRHLLYVYLSVWLIQGAYCAWVMAQWMRSKGASQMDAPSASDEDS